MTRPPVLLATWSEMPEGEVGGGELIVDACRARGVEARWEVWDDPRVDWSAGLVAVRSTWDYEQRIEEFLAWARAVPRLLNGAEVFTWNSDKGYLVELAEQGVPVVPTIAVAPDDPEGLTEAIAAFDDPVVKPRIGAGGRGVCRPARGERPEPSPNGYVVQPLMESVRTEGETSVFVLGGRCVGQVRKVAAAGEIRVHEEYGGRTVPVDLDDEAVAVARAAVAAAEQVVGRPLDYARVDQMRAPSGELVVSELEAIEPGLYLDVMPENAVHFAEFLALRE